MNGKPIRLLSLLACALAVAALGAAPTADRYANPFAPPDSGASATPAIPHEAKRLPILTPLPAKIPFTPGPPTARDPFRTPAARAAPVSHDADTDDVVQCANLIYAGAKTSKCFSDKFLEIVGRETNIRTEKKFKPVKLAEEEVFRYPFAVMTGEGAFNLLEQERKNLREYLTRGGFLLASASCSSDEWNRSFRVEIQKVFPDRKLQKIPQDHPLFQTVFDIQSLQLKSGGKGVVEGLEHNGKIVCIYSPEGLNDTPDVQGCCCCGGNEVRNAKEVNVNVFTYALTH